VSAADGWYPGYQAPPRPVKAEAADLAVVPERGYRFRFIVYDRRRPLVVVAQLRQVVTTQAWHVHQAGRQVGEVHYLADALELVLESLNGG